jgi:uncharacterized protein YndB with AHSA1/START domain
VPEATNPNQVVLERTLDAPIELVWRMWTDSAHFAAWYGPTGANIPEARMEVRVGGTRLICMEMNTPNGKMQMWFTGEYLDIEPPRRLVYTEAMSDEQGNIKSPAEAGMPEGSPTTTTVTVELEEIDGKTRMVMTHAGVPAGSPGEAGWRMAFDKLVAHVGEQ